MSRIGKMPVALPQGIDVTVAEGNFVTVKGPKGQLQQQFPPEIAFEFQDHEVHLIRPSDDKPVRALHGLSRALLFNMVQGVTSGYARTLEVEGVGYRAGMVGQNLVVFVGYSHPVEFAAPEGISFEVDKPGRTITIKGIDRQAVSQLAAQIRSLREPEPYKGKGIRWGGEVVRQKAGKSGKVGGKGKK